MPKSSGIQWLGGNYLSMMRECVCLGEIRRFVCFVFAGFWLLFRKLRVLVGNHLYNELNTNFRLSGTVWATVGANEPIN